MLSTLDRLQDEVLRLTEQNAQLTTRLHEQEHTIESLQHELASRQEQIDSLERRQTELEDALTEQTESAAALRISETELQAVLDNCPAVIYVKEADGRMLRVNRQFEQLFHVERDEVKGKSNYDLFPPEFAEAFRENDRKILAEGKPITVEEFAPHDDGLHTYLSVKFPIFSADGVPYALGGISTDISDRKQVEETLQEQTALLQLILDSMSDGVIVANVDAKFLVLNPAAQEMHGTLTTDVAAGGWSQHYGLFLSDGVTPFPEEDLPLVRALRGERVENVEIFIRSVGAEEGRWVMVNGCPLKDSEGNLKGGLIVLRDVSDRKQAELALQQSEERFRSLITATSHIIWDTKAEGEFVTPQPSWSAFTGQSFDQLRGWGWLNAIHPDDQPHTARIWSAAVATKTLYEVEHRLRRHDGEYRYMSVRAVPIVEIDGSIREWVGIHTDVTDRKQAEAELRDREEQLRTINTFVPGAIYQHEENLETGEAWFSYFSPKAAEIFELDADRLLESNPLMWQMIHPEDLPGLIESTQRAIHNHQSWSGEFRITTPSSVEKWVSGRSEPIQSPEGYSRHIGIFIDITDRKRTEQAIQQKTQELEQTLHELQRTQSQLVQTEKMSSLGQLVAGVAHEINNPVNFIYGNLTHASGYIQDLLGLVELYQRQYPNPTAAIQQEAADVDLEFLLEDLPKLLNSMKVGADRIQKIVASLRNFSRMDEAEVKAVDIHEGIDSTLMILHNRIKERADHIGIEVVKEYGTLPLVECYAGQLNQVFMNILSNAIDALEEGHEAGKDAETRRGDAEKLSQSSILSPQSSPLGTPLPTSHFPLPTIWIRTEAVNNHVVIRIADNGAGMPEEVRQRIFEPFYTTKPVGKGTGLGLSISYQVVVEKHNGSLHCMSTSGHGTEFTIELPI